jgi:hypothetical protein
LVTVRRGRAQTLIHSYTYDINAKVQKNPEERRRASRDGEIYKKNVTNTYFKILILK